MEKHYFICDRCHKEYDEEDIFTISRKYRYASYDMVDGEYEGTFTRNEKYHLCKHCFDKIKPIIFNT